ncbi:uncharacterized protein PADG_04317 [Paracoccidioides brasiliensis Pb18]|uniref:Uncharacterized protein n=1 Tax=Paracoccidioides brasiliensis (strain Pb18) TaxID=502780 RepID=C1GAN1_PARBD|nr:uncharacterized protein PADG_04317 [Paracoccidioides brasiliensis Pb18]EEH48233.2 hypothetical protein PADG_04317 [Paracoccidioides brasiliensis Pb18]
MDHIFPSLQDASRPSTTPRSHYSTSLKCCCGRSECAYLQHNNAALADLEKDVETAAQLGQALLQRHEAYITDAEGDRSRLLLEMENLERDKREAQAENARIIEENRELLEQLEEMNKAIAESDAQIKSLTMTLESSQLQVKQLSVSASRVSQLESQIDVMEKEQEELQVKLIVTEEDEKSAVQRWRQAECTLRDLEGQLERIERKSREEQEKHAELLRRMELHRTVKEELDTAAGRLKGASATSPIGQRKPGVVTSFVRDILQDNANLQMGIVELREMLQASNEEVENLRELILLHQPLALETDDRIPQHKKISLRDELDAKLPPAASQEFHVHHHYHSPTQSLPQRKEKAQTPLHRHQRKRRPLISSPILESQSRPSSRLSRISHSAHGSVSSPSTILSQTSVSIPSASSNRHCSIQSSSVVPASICSSIPSSPQSVYRTSSIFDRVDHGFDSSRPTSPESNGFASPSIRPYHHRKGLSDMPIRPISVPPELQNMSAGLSGGINQGRDDTVESTYYSADERIPPYFQPPIPEERETPTEEITNEQGMQYTAFPVPVEEPDPFSPLLYNTVKRASSHESLLSISGMDIHTLRSRPSQMLSPYSALPIRAPSHLTSACTELSFTPPVISPMNIIAPRVSLRDGNKGPDSRSLLSSFVAAPAEGNSNATPSGALPNNIPYLRHADRFSKRVGGWVFGRWGMAPIASPRTGDLSSPRSSFASPSRPPNAPSVSAASSASTLASAPSVPSPRTSSTARASAAVVFRPPGVNQIGTILGLRPPGKPPMDVQPMVINEDLLQESLLE